MLKNKIIHQNFFVIRSPRFTIKELFKFGTKTSDTQQVIEHWLAQPEFIEALYVASPSLYNRITKLDSKGNIQSNNKLEYKLQKTIVKYIIRMCSRPTPFGLFSGVCKGNISSETNLHSNALSSDSRKTRLDMYYLTGFKEFILKFRSRSQSLIYYPNSSQYMIGQQYRYIEGYQSNMMQQYRLSAIGIDEYSSYILEKAKKGENFDNLISLFILEYPDVDKEDVVEYLQSLIDESVLIAQLHMPITGCPPDQALTNSLFKLGEKDFAEHLIAAGHKLDQLDHDKINDPERYKEVLTHLSKVPINVEESKLFQTDVYRSFNQCEFEEKHVSKLLHQLKLISALGHKPEGYFNTFIGKFNERFEGQLVPMMSLLDEESGISFSDETGYEAPLISGLALTYNNRVTNSTRNASLLDYLITQAITLPENRNSSIIKLTSKYLAKQLTKPLDKNSLPVSFAALISLYENKHDLLIKFTGCYGPSAANLLGRFCHLNDELTTNVIDHLEQESEHSPDVIFAEIVHMPEGRPGNVIARPNLRKYEIVFLADSNLDDEYQIQLSDLYVCVENGIVKLWSHRLGKRIIPRLSCAHDVHSNSLSAYKFLSLLQYQDGNPPKFTMPESQSMASFVPRIMLDNLILSEKIWRIPRESLASVIKSGAYDLKELGSLKLKYQLDDFISFAVGDNILNLNLNNPVMFDILLQETKNQTLVELKESLICKYDTPIKSPQNECYANELIIPFINTEATVTSELNISDNNEFKINNVNRLFSPGSEWLSLKIYSGNATLDDLLAEKIIPFIESNSNIFKKWFFIRYSDPDWHLRLRFYGNAKDLCSDLLPNINLLLEPMIVSGEIQKFELFTYIREVERYGGEATIALVESLFMHDSELVVKSISLENEYGDDIRWRITLLMIDALLNNFGFTKEKKLNLITELRNAFGKEFHETKILRKQLGIKYKSIENKLKSDLSIKWLSNGISDGSLNNVQQVEGFEEEVIAMIELLKCWQKGVLPIINKLIPLMSLNEKEANSNINSRMGTLMSSIIHMHINRMFKAYGREHELVLNDLLRRYYFSLMKNNKVVT